MGEIILVGVLCSKTHITPFHRIFLSFTTHRALDFDGPVSFGACGTASLAANTFNEKRERYHYVVATSKS